MTRRSDPAREAENARSAADVSRALGARQRVATREPADRQAVPRPTILVRRATLADLPVIVELRLSLLRENAGHPIYGQLRADARERAYDIFGGQLRSAHEVMFLAELDGEVVGILRCVDTLNSPLLHPERYCYVSSVYVRLRSRRRGVLKALLRRAEAWCTERGLTEMRLHNVPGGSASAAWGAERFAVVEEVRLKVLGGREGDKG